MEIGNFGFSSSGGGGGGTPIVGGGTLNYICKFTPNGTTINNSLLYDDGTSVGIGTNTPDASALLDLNSTTQGFAAPRMTTLQRNAIVAPTVGLLIYNTSSSFFNYWDGSAWIQMDTSTGGDVSGSGTTNYAVKWTDGANSVIGDGTWYFSGNDYLPVTTGSNIGDATHRIGTIFMASIFDYANNLTFYNGTSTTATLTTSGLFGINVTPIGAARLEIVGGAYQGAYIQSSGSIGLNSIDPSGYAIKGETSTGFGLFSKITNGSGTSGVAIRAHDQNGNTMFTVNGDGYVGIGTLSPNAMLDIIASGSGTIGINLNTSSTQDAKLYFRTNNAASARSQIYLNDSTQTLNFYTVNNDTIFWNGNGLAQTKTLTLFTDTTAKFESNVGVGVSPNSTSRFIIQGIDNTSLHFGLKVDDSVGNPLLYVRNDAKVSIGKTTTSTTLDIQGDTTNTLFKLNNSNFLFSDKLRVDNIGSFYSGSINGFGAFGTGNFTTDHLNYTFNTSYSTFLAFTNAGGAGNKSSYGIIGGGIGSSDSDYKLVVLNSDAGTLGSVLKVVSTASSSVNDGFDYTSYGLNIISNGIFTNAGAGTFYKVGLNINISNADVNYAALFNGGNVGVGTSSPTAKFHVLSGDILFEGSVNGSRFNYGGGEDTYIRSGKNGRTVYISDNINGNVLMASGGGTVAIGNGSVNSDQLSVYGVTRIKGIDSTSLNYALKVDNSLSTPLLYVRNDGVIDVYGTITPRIQSLVSSATVTPTNLNDEVIITSQAVGLTLANPTGTAVQGQSMIIRIKDNGTAQTIAYDTQYRAIGVTLPITTVINKIIYLGLIYNSTDTKWDIIGVQQEV